MAKLTTAEFIDAIKELSVLELNDLVKACEEEFGVSAAAGVVVAAAGADGAAAEEKTEFESLRDVLEGPSAFAVSTDDATAPARILAKFAKTAPALEIKAGVVEGTYYDAEGMKTIASVPSRDELLSKLLGSLQSPITNLARVLNQIAEQGGSADAAAETAEAPAEA